MSSEAWTTGANGACTLGVPWLPALRPGPRRQLARRGNGPVFDSLGRSVRGVTPHVNAHTQGAYAGRARRSFGPTCGISLHPLDATFTLLSVLSGTQEQMLYSVNPFIYSLGLSLHELCFPHIFRVSPSNRHRPRCINPSSIFVACNSSSFPRFPGFGANTLTL